MTQEQYEMELEEKRQREQSEMEDYHRKQYEHECYMEQKKPKEPNIESYRQYLLGVATEYFLTDQYNEAMDKYKKDLSEWQKEFHMDAPNKPGYYRANND